MMNAFSIVNWLKLSFYSLPPLGRTANAAVLLGISPAKKAGAERPRLSMLFYFTRAPATSSKTAVTSFSGAGVASDTATSAMQAAMNAGSSS